MSISSVPKVVLVSVTAASTTIMGALGGVLFVWMLMGIEQVWEAIIWVSDFLGISELLKEEFLFK